VTPEQFATAIGQIESRGNALAWGDYIGTPSLPRAMGRFQIWAAELWTWALRLKIVPTENETYDSWVFRILCAFFPFHTAQGLTPVQVAMTWHLGHEVIESDSEWDAVYAAEFNAAVG
jgi:hypothetical protein